MKIVVVNGPNLNLLGIRNKNHYGDFTLSSLNELIKKEFPDINFEFYQSNVEGEIINKIQSCEKDFEGLLINPGGYAHTSVSIKDALELIKIPKVEVHLSHIANREDYRQKLITATACEGYISGFKENSYLAGIYLLKKMIAEKEYK